MTDVTINKFRASVVRDGSKPSSPGFIVSEGQDPVNPPGTNNYVPYSGATANVELGEYGVEAGFITLDTTPTNIPTEQGGIYWDDSRSTAALIMNGTLQHIGQDTFFYVKNSTGSSIAKGTAVRFDGTDGASGHLKIAPFLANGTYPSNYFMGVTAEAIANGSFGQVMHFGELTGVNTSGYTAGALLYASTSVAGAFQTTAPVAPNNIVLVAAAINSTNNGTILVRPTYGSNINQDEGVKITSGTTGDLLQLQAGGLWENKTLAQVIGSAYVPSTRTITINGTTQDLSANRTYNVGTVTAVTASSPLFSSGGTTPNITIQQASGSQNGFLSSTDWTTFNSKQNALTNPVTGTGTSGQVAYFNGTSAITGESGLVWDATNNYLSIGGATANSNLTVSGSDNSIIFSVLAGVNSRLHVGTVSSGTIAYVRSQNNYALNLGVNTTDYLSISTAGNSSFSGNIILTTGANRYVRIGSSTAYYYDLQTNGDDFQIIEAGTTPRLTIKYPNGNIGINTTTPATTLEVNGVALFSGTSLSGNTKNGVYIYDQSILSLAGGNARPLTIQSQTLSIFTGTTYSEKVKIFDNGNVVISTSPSDAGFKLDVNGTGRFSGNLRAASFSNAGLQAGEVFNATKSNAGYFVAYFQNTSATGLGLNIQNGNDANDSIRISNAAGTANNILLYGDGKAYFAGNVGIGTTSPGNFNGLSFASPILDVAGSIQIKGIAANGIAALQFGGETYRKALIYSSIAADTPYLAFGIGSSGSSSSASEVMRINSSGFLKASNTGTYASSTGTYHELMSNQSGNNIAYLWNTSASPYGPYVRFSGAAPNNGTNYYFYCDDTSAARFIVYSNGGISNYQANNTNLSDERTKKEIAPLESYWDKFKAIEIVKFKYKDQTHDDFNIGVIAQQVEKVAPEFVDVDGWDNKTEGNEVVSQEEPIKSIYTADLHHATIKVLQEAMAKIEEMQKEIDTLKN